jgi:hypothetical protein
MSRGLGRIERAIASTLDYSGTAVSDRLARDVFEPSFRDGDDYDVDAYYAWKPSRSQRIATVRAMRSFVRKNPQLALAGGRGRSPLYIYNTEDKPSGIVAAAEQAASEFGVKLRKARASAKRARSGKGRLAAEAAAEVAAKRKAEAEKVIRANRS